MTMGVNLAMPVVAGIVMTLVLTALVGTQLHREVWQQQADSAQKMLEQVNTIRQEGNITIERLNQLQVGGCTTELLNEMRKALFFSSHLRDIGYVQDGQLLCSTGRGRLETPLQESPPDYVSAYGFKVWPQATVEIFGQSIVAPMAAKGSFSLVYDDTLLNGLFPKPYQWQLAYHHNDLFEPVLGEEGVFRHGGSGKSEVSLRAHYFSLCSDRHPYCVAVTVDNLALAARHGGLLAVLVGSCLIAGVATMVMVANLLRWRSSPRNRLRRGLRAGHFHALYQPIVELATGRVIGCEVLARFSDSEGPLYPDRFIPLIANLGLSWPFTRKMIQEAVSALEHDRSIPDGFLVNVNLFPEDITAGRIREIGQVAAWTDTRLQLNFEITEDQQLDTGSAHSNLQWLRDQGYGLAVDDFGTGYSNLSQIRDLHCDALKIDRSFITDIEEGGVRAAIVPIMVRLADELKLKVVAEGIENEAQRRIVMGLGITCGQGWLYGKPMPARDLARVVAESLDYPDKAGSVVNG